jgi:signal transduction histidine kinase
MTQQVPAAEHARLVEELARRNDQLAAIDAIGRLAARTPDLRDFLDDAARIVEETTRCASLLLYAVDPGSETLSLLHHRGAPPELLPALDRVPIVAPAVFTVSQPSADVVTSQVYPERFRAIMDGAGTPTLARVPLVVGSRVVGILAVGFRERDVREAERHLQFLRAAGAVIGAVVSSDGLLGTLRRRLSNLTLINDLAVASAQLDPVVLLEGALRRAAVALGAEMGASFLREGEELTATCMFGTRPEAMAAGRVIGQGAGPASQAVQDRDVRTWPDPEAIGGRFAEAMRGEGLQAVAGVPLLTKGEPVGALVLGRRTPRPFDEEEVRLLRTLGAQVGVALENSRLLAEARSEIEHLESVHALALRVFVHPPGDEGALLRDGCREISRALGARVAFAFLLTEDGETLAARAVHGLDLDLTALRLPIEADRLAHDAVRHGIAGQTRDCTLDARCAMSASARVPPMALLAVPLGSRALARGAIYLGDQVGRVFTESEVALARAMAAALAVGVENAGLRLDLGKSHAELERAQERLLQGERLAALGALSAAVAHEVRNPLGVMFNAIGMLRRLRSLDESSRALVEMLGEEAERLNRIVTDLLGFARPAVPSLRTERLGPIVEEAVRAALTPTSPPIELAFDLAPDLPPIAVDAGLVRQAVLNVVLNAVQAMPKGGRLAVRTRSDGGHATVEVLDTGPGIPDTLRERVFEPFFTTKTRGTGLGLSIVRHVLEVHGGVVTAERAAGGGTRLSLRFPLAPAAGR